MDRATLLVLTQLSVINMKTIVYTPEFPLQTLPEQLSKRDNADIPGILYERPIQPLKRRADKSQTPPLGKWVKFFQINTVYNANGNKYDIYNATQDGSPLFPFPIQQMLPPNSSSVKDAKEEDENKVVLPFNPQFPYLPAIDPFKVDAVNQDSEKEHSYHLLPAHLHDGDLEGYRNFKKLKQRNIKDSKSIFEKQKGRTVIVRPVVTMVRPKHNTRKRVPIPPTYSYNNPPHVLKWKPKQLQNSYKPLYNQEFIFKPMRRNQSQDQHEQNKNKYKQSKEQSIEQDRPFSNMSTSTVMAPFKVDTSVTLDLSTTTPAAPITTKPNKRLKTKKIKLKERKSKNSRKVTTETTPSTPVTVEVPTTAAPVVTSTEREISAL